MLHKQITFSLFFNIFSLLNNLGATNLVKLGFILESNRLIPNVPGNKRNQKHLYI